MNACSFRCFVTNPAGETTMYVLKNVSDVPPPGPGSFSSMPAMMTAPLSRAILT
jgi:hypothetical protein